MPTYEIRIEPIDPLLFGDNRSARAGVDHLQFDQDPSPLTLHGAIGQFLADQSQEWPAKVLGERQTSILDPKSKVAELLGFCLHRAGGGLVFSRPRHLRCTLLKESQLRPEDFVIPHVESNAKSSAEWERLLLSTDSGALKNEVEDEVLLTKSALGDVLCGEMPMHAEPPGSVYRAEPRPGIAVDNTSGTVFEGQLFTRPYRRFRPSQYEKAAHGTPAGFTAWLSTLAPLDIDLHDAIGFLGGDRRRARFDFRPAGEVALSDLRDQVADAAEQTDSRGFLLVLLTSALQTDKRIEVGKASPVTAALGKPVFASGWDEARNRPRPIRMLIPAGSVFFFDWPQDAPPGTPRADLVRRLWLRPLHEQGSAAGFGRCLAGIWK